MTIPTLHPFVFRFGRVGDMIMVTGLLHFLHARYGRPCYVAGAGPWNEDVLLGHPDVARSWSFTRHSPFLFTRAWPKVLAALHQSAPGPVYICEYQYRQLPRVKRMLAFSGIDQRRCVYIDDDPSRGRHWLDSMLRFAQLTPAALHAADYPIPRGVNVGAPRLQILESERAERDARMEAQGWSGRPLILFQPGNHRSMSRRRERYRRLNTDDKAWPIERWVALAQGVHSHMPEALIVLRGSVEEVPMLHEIRAAVGLDTVVVAGLGLRQTFALCEAAHSMISVDTGPAHAAAALGVPLLVLYGAESPNVWLPRSPTGSPVIGIGGPPHSTRLDQISVSTVLEAWRTLIDQMKQESGNVARGATLGSRG